MTKNPFYQIQQYLKYLIVSKTRYTIHSPFVFDLVNNVLRDTTIYDDFTALEEMKSSLFQRTDHIETVDFGSGAGKKKYATKVGHLGRMVKLRSQHKRQLNLLYRLTRYFKPNYMLEFGTAAGISASYLKKGHPQGHLITMEGCASLAAVAEEGFKKLEIVDIEVKVGSFDVILPDVLTLIPQLDFVFIDGNHRKDPTLKYFNQCYPLTSENSVFVFDDIHWSEGMDEAWKMIKSDPRVSLTIDLFWLGLVFFKKDIQKQDFIIRY